ncbi:MAG TPA: aminotransferase class III-fold pyridoxal phosphate-dependent enzyme, partial [Pyrinomonadaceae bacterium]|nr:aminotransferase class III-fold pyridoxal phosphate-dependent enzyme [Pyrinomonadaceae bacterium]
MSQPQPARVEKVLSELKGIFARIAGIGVEEVVVDVTLLELGVDSLTMIQATQTIQSALGVKVPFRVLVEDNPTLDGLAAYIENEMPPESPAVAATVVEPANVSAGGAVLNMKRQEPLVELRAPERAEAASRASSNGQHNGAAPETGVSRLIARQLEIMSEQLELLRGRHAEVREAVSPEASATAAVSQTDAEAFEVAAVGAHQPLALAAETGNGAGGSVAAQASADAPTVAAAPFKTETHVPYKPTRVGAGGGLSPRQQQHLDDLIARFCRKTANSKRQAERRREVLADSRTSAGFRLLWKEMLYTLVAERAEGARVWDADGNEYVDITMGYGALLFGHQPASVEALETQFKQGIQMGFISDSVGRAADLVRELTGVERVTFCNSGTEAVMIALRLARTVTGRSKVAFFAGSYHGFFDEVLVRPSVGADGESCMAPIAPGIPASAAENMLVLNYGDPASLDVLRAHADELAAVLVEPVQSRQPDLQPVEFLRELRELTRAAGAALIFDEVITGFRVHPGGVAARFGVEADIVTYGKGIGAGVPVGVVAGKAAYLDAIDGGMWSYGDASFPRAERTYVAGTYFMHPVTMAAVSAALTHLKDAGPRLQEQLNERTTRLAETLNDYFEREQVPIRVVHYGSLFRFVFSPEVKLADLFFYQLLEKGVYTWEGRNCFISTAHTDEDIAFVIDTVKASVAEMRAGGFIADRIAADDETHAGTGPRLVAATNAQKELWVLTQMGENASRAYHESVTLELRGTLDVPAMHRAIRKLVARHEALRTTFSPDGEFQKIHTDVELDVPLVDFTDAGGGARESEVSEWLAEQARRPFVLEDAPPVRFGLARVAADEHLLALTLHHIITDGWSNGVLIREIGILYAAELGGVKDPLPSVMGFGEYSELLERREQSAEMKAAEAYWLGQFSDPARVLELPSDRRRPPVQTYAGARSRSVIEASLLKEIRGVGAKLGTTPFVTLLAAFKILLHRLSGQDDLVVGSSAAGQPHAGDNNLVGYCTNLLALRSKMDGNPAFKDYAASVKKVVLDAYEHQIYPFARLIRQVRNFQRDPSRPPLVSVIFNMDTRLEGGEPLPGLEVNVSPNLPAAAKYDLNLNVTQTNEELWLDWEYNTDLFDAQTVERWQGHFRVLLESIAADPQQSVMHLPLLRTTEQTAPPRRWDERVKVRASAATIHELFDRQAARTPDAIALLSGDEQITYAELLARSNRLA